MKEDLADDFDRYDEEERVEIGNLILPKLCESLEDDSAWVRYSAMVAIHTIAGFLRFDVEQTVFTHIAKSCLSMLDDGDDDIVEQAASTLWAIQDVLDDDWRAAIAEHCEACLGHDEAAVRSQLLGTLSSCGEHTTPHFDRIVAMLDDDDGGVRGAAAGACWSPGAEPTSDQRQAMLDRLVVMLTADEDQRAREGAAIALGYVGAGCTPALSALVRALNDPDSDVRHHALYAIGEHGAKGEPAIPHLEQLLDDAERQEDAAFVIEQIGTVGAVALLDQRGIERQLD
jgi:HEAT repeat protein